MQEVACSVLYYRMCGPSELQLSYASSTNVSTVLSSNANGATKPRPEELARDHTALKITNPMRLMLLLLLPTIMKMLHPETIPVFYLPQNLSWLAKITGDDSTSSFWSEKTPIASSGWNLIVREMPASIPVWPALSGLSPAEHLLE